MTHPCVYLITCSYNGKLYVGKTTNAKLRWTQHMSASRKPAPRMVISRAMRKHGVGSFTFEVLETFQTEEDALWWEGRYIEYLGSHLRGVGYNLDSGGHGGKKLSLATRQKLSKLHQGKKLSHETRAKLSTAKLGKPQTLEHIEKAAATRRGKKRSPGTIAKLRAANIGKKLSVEHRAKLSESHKNSEANIVQIAKLATANRGKKRSPEALLKMRVAQQARRTKERERELEDK